MGAARETTTTETDTAETTAIATASEIGTTTVVVVAEEGEVDVTIATETLDDTGPDPETGTTAVTATVTAGARAPQFATETDMIDATIGLGTEVEEADVMVPGTLAVIGVTQRRVRFTTEHTRSTALFLALKLTHRDALTPQKTG